jgi:2-polyprenyl-6-methoxyphenol hydroxylase-like FAD-dependent oxidoreductase
MLHRHPFKVIIIGAGTGGLCLAQGLNSSGITVEVFERDRTPTDRLQGYRLSINAQGSRALKSCLPEALFAQFVRGAAIPSQSVTFLDHRMRPLLGLDLTRGAHGSTDREWPVSRIILRRVLLEGLDSIVTFGKTCVGFDAATDGHVIARFADGTAAQGDVLVAADGASSRLRTHLLPDAKRIDTGIVAVSGKFTLDEATRAGIPEPIMRGPTLVLGPRGCFMFANAVLYDRQDHLGCDGEREADYVMWGFSAHRDELAFSALPDAVSGAEARSQVLELTKAWNPALRDLVEKAELATMNIFSVKTSVPISPWVTRNVTLLGDALHNMTPFRGIGANTALRDAQSLHRMLVKVTEGKQALIPALAQYERDMIDYGFHAVRDSLKDMERFHATSALALGVTKTLFRAVDRLPLLKSAFLGR